MGLLFGADAVLAAPIVNFDGMGRIRSEKFRNANDFNLTNGGANRQSSTVSKFNLGFNIKPMEDSDWNIYFQPTFSKTSGASGTSGALNDTATYAVHQAYINYKIADRLTLKAGRQQLVYGDQLLIGSVGWANTNRAFDAMKLSFKDPLMNGTTDLWASKISENNSAYTNAGDKDFYGLYHSCNMFGAVDNFDAYYLAVVDKAGTTLANGDFNSDKSTTRTYGTRLKSKLGAFDYRVELTGQQAKATIASKSKGAYQYDVELGYKLPFLGTRFSVEYLKASVTFDQLYPTGHKWLGYMDLLSRKNVKGYVFHLKMKPMDKLLIKADYHVYSRLAGSTSATNVSTTYTAVSGAAQGAAADKNKLFSELDITVKYTLSEKLFLQGGYSFASPDEYFESQAPSQKDKSSFSYLQLLAKF